MTEDTSVQAQLDAFRRRRAHRRGQVTKLKNRVHKIQSTPPDEIDALSVDDLLLDLQTQISDHDHLQSQIEEIYSEHPELAADEDADEKLQEAHRLLKNILIAYQKAGPYWAASTVIIQQLERASASPRPDSPHFRNTVDGLVAEFKSLSINSSSIIRHVPHLRDRIAILEEKSSHLQKLISEDFRDAK